MELSFLLTLKAQFYCSFKSANKILFKLAGTLLLLITRSGNEYDSLAIRWAALLADLRINNTRIVFDSLSMSLHC